MLTYLCSQFSVRKVQDDDDSTESNALLPSPTEEVHKHSGLDEETEYFLSKVVLNLLSLSFTLSTCLIVFMWL